MILRHPERFQTRPPQRVEMWTPASLVEQRKRLVNDGVKITNRLRCTLKEYKPQALEWFDRIDTMLFCEILRRLPTLSQIKRARKSTLAHDDQCNIDFRSNLLKSDVWKFLARETKR